MLYLSKDYNHYFVTFMLSLLYARELPKICRKLIINILFNNQYLILVIIIHYNSCSVIYSQISFHILITFIKYIFWSVYTKDFDLFGSIRHNMYSCALNT